MAVDRDLGVAVALALAGDRRLRAWEMLAATGVRGLRLANETSTFSEILLTEANDEAARVLVENAARFADRGAQAEQRDARAGAGPRRFDFVDVDPYGSPAPFLDSALEALDPPGTLAITATDMMVLAGVDRRACERRYGGRPLRGRLAPEGGLRILLAHASARAGARGLAIHPLIAYVRDHHVRAYLRIEPVKSAEALPIATVSRETWSGPALPSGGPFGPMWLGPLLDPSFVRRLVVPPTAERGPEVAAYLAGFVGELTSDVPFFYESNAMAKDLHLMQPPPREDVGEAIVERGYHWAPTRTRAGAFRSTAPRAVVEEIARRLSERPTVRG